MDQKVVVAMSGGVDSSVAALLLKERGFKVVGAMMKLYDSDVNTEQRGCCTAEDASDAQSVATKLGIEFYNFNFKDKFKKYIIEEFVSAYENGQTPNPCIMCNKIMKFKFFLKRAMEIEARFIASGHYVRNFYDSASKRFLLKKAIDSKKDQSYVLWNMTQDELSKTLFPIGEFTKIQIREIANNQKLSVANKKESQDICFVKGQYGDFIKKYRDTNPKKNTKNPPSSTDINITKNGKFFHISGKFLGNSKSVINYTIGQRRGLGISHSEPLYVKSINSVNNTIILAENNKIFAKQLVANNINLIATKSLEKPLKLKAKIRYNQKEEPAVVEQISQDSIAVSFDNPQRAIAKGQSVVFYDGDVVIGGGIINSVYN